MKIIKKILIVFACLVLLAVGALYYFFYSLDSISFDSVQEPIGTYDSPNRDYTLKTYRVNGGATVDFAVRGRVQFNKENNREKTIYWDYHKYDATVQWLDNKTVVINGHTLNVLKDTYDWRHD